MASKLPPWKIFKGALLLLWEKLRFALRIALPIIVLLVAIVLATAFGLIDDSATASPGAGNFSVQGVLSFLAKVSVFFLMLGFLACVMAVFWHRNILLQEDTLPSLPIRFDAVTWRYVGYGVLLLLILGLLWTVSFSAIMFLWTQLFALGFPMQIAALFIVVSLFLWLGVISFRMALVLPAAAIGHRNFGLGDAWELARGNNWRLLAINVLQWMLITALGLVTRGLDFIATKAGGLLPGILVFSLDVFFNLMTFLLGVGLLSVTYAYLTYKKPEPAPTQAK